MRRAKSADGPAVGRRERGLVVHGPFLFRNCVFFLGSVQVDSAELKATSQVSYVEACSLFGKWLGSVSTMKGGVIFECIAVERSSHGHYL